MARPKTKPSHGVGLSEETVQYTNGVSDSNCAELLRESLLTFQRTGDPAVFTTREKTRLARIGFLAYSRGGTLRGYRLTEKALSCIGSAEGGRSDEGTVGGPDAAPKGSHRGRRTST